MKSQMVTSRKRLFAMGAFEWPIACMLAYTKKTIQTRESKYWGLIFVHHVYSTPKFAWNNYIKTDLFKNTLHIAFSRRALRSYYRKRPCSRDTGDQLTPRHLISASSKINYRNSFLSFIIPKKARSTTISNQLFEQKTSRAIDIEKHSARTRNVPENRKRSDRKFSAPEYHVRQKERVRFWKINQRHTICHMNHKTRLRSKAICGCTVHTIRRKDRTVPKVWRNPAQWTIWSQQTHWFREKIGPSFKAQQSL